MPIKTKTNAHSPRVRQNGFSLIEVMIAVILLSIGLLGLAGLQTTSLRSNGSSLVRSQANAIAYDILDSMRANRSAAESGAYDKAFGAGASASGNLVAVQDITGWKTELQNSLPGGQGSITQTNPGGTVFAVSVRWQEAWDKSNANTGTNGGYQTITLRTEL